MPCPGAASPNMEIACHDDRDTISVMNGPIITTANRAPTSFEILMFACHRLAKSLEILMFICLEKDANNAVVAHSSIVVLCHRGV